MAQLYFIPLLLNLLPVAVMYLKQFNHYSKREMKSKLVFGRPLLSPSVRLLSRNSRTTLSQRKFNCQYNTTPGIQPFGHTFT